MFEASDFDIFEAKTLPERMAKIQQIIDPKFEELASHFLPILSEHTGQVWYAHVAKHARRTVYPPDNTWVAFSTSKRGYKMLPHFEFGIWEDHLYLWFALLENLKDKPQSRDEWTKKILIQHQKIVKMADDNWQLSTDHMANIKLPYSQDILAKGLVNFQESKHGELLLGQILSKEHLISDENQQLQFFEDTLNRLIPIYDLFR